MNGIDWTQVLVGLLGVLGAVDLGRLVFFRSSKKKADAEAEGAVLQNEKVEIEALKDAIDEVRKSNDRFLEIHEKDTAAIAEKNKRIVELSEDVAALKMMVCKHDACPFREPVKGRGGQWWENQKHSDEITDAESITAIGKRKGYLVKRLPEKKPKNNADVQA